MASSSYSNQYIQQPSIPIFHGENYDFWAIKMKTLFMSQEVWEIVQDGYDEIEDTSTLDQTQKDLLKESRRKNAKAYMYIQQGVGDTILPRVIHSYKAKEAWDLLQQEYGGNKKVRELKLHSYRRDFENLRMNENECLNEFSSRVVEVVNNIMMCAIKKNEYEGESTSNFKGNGKWKKGGANSNNYTKSDSSQVPRCSFCKKNGHLEKNCWNKGKPQCRNCKKYGHLEKDCRYKEDEEQAGRAEEKKDKQNLFYACQSTMVTSKSEVWFVYSGCTTHMSGEKSLFVDMDTSINILVNMGDGNMVQANGRGTICVQTINGAKYIKDVLYVPDLAQNLLSVGKLVELGYVVHFEDGY
ncbi:uncharacterized protein LOC113360476 [Papaver somniferum]|uniref:uncharacterized protein LOC113360476 n=1 Tax=Papaver somniferum TaxID=3469 RepID=UPI000E704C52|nr:uncharacterized protein LOC113360476 [Papaver somniferum]